MQDLAVALGWGIVAIAFFSYLGVKSWLDAQRREREAFYRSEAIKKVAEMHGTVSEPVLAALRDSLKPPPQTPPPRPESDSTAPAVTLLARFPLPVPDIRNWNRRCGGAEGVGPGPGQMNADRDRMMVDG